MDSTEIAGGTSAAAAHQAPSRHRRFNWWRQFVANRGLGQRLAVLLLLGGVIAALLASMGLLALADANESLRVLYEERMTKVRNVGRIQRLIISNRLLLQTALSAVEIEYGVRATPRLALNPGVARASAEVIEQNFNTITALWIEYRKTALGSTELELAERVEQSRVRYIEWGLRAATAALRSGDYLALQRATQVASNYFVDLAPKVQDLNQMQFQLANETYRRALERYQQTRALALFALLLSMLVMVWLGVQLIRSIVLPLQRMVGVFRQIGCGRYDTPIVVEGAVEISTVLGALKRMQTKLGVDEATIRELAFHDPLTHLPNRRLLRDRMELALSVSARNGLYGAVLLIDLDNFKALNDTMGHDVGDGLLVQMAARIKGCLRLADTVARPGGDEFVVVVVDLSAEASQAAVQAEGVGEKILNAIRQPCLVAGKRHQTSASVGISLFPDHETTVDDLLKRADLAMYQAKEQGRNGQRFFDPQIQSALESRMALEIDLRDALPNNQLELYYQIQVDDCECVLGAEVLLRWNHPDLGLVGPMDFIPIAEESGLIVPIGLWVLKTACEQLKRWECNPDTAEFVLSVNVSARQFGQHDFVASVCQTIADLGVNPRRLKLEITESAVLHDVGDTVSKMHALNQHGIEFSMDDFGTGYSSLSQLKKLPVAQLKIDRSFVCNITTDKHDEVIVQTIIGMANNLGMAVIAEGVETAEQQALLAQLGCHAYQGFLFGRPVPLVQFEEQVYNTISISSHDMSKGAIQLIAHATGTTAR